MKCSIGFISEENSIKEEYEKLKKMISLAK
jgi:hypothetical protein